MSNRPKITKGHPSDISTKREWFEAFCQEREIVKQLTAEVARLTVERDQLKAEIQIKDAAIEGALRRAERAEDALKGRS